jgi:hypothetical protein
LLMPFLFNGDLAHGSLPDFLKAGCWAKFARTKLSKVPPGSMTKIKFVASVRLPTFLRHSDRPGENGERFSGWRVRELCRSKPGTAPSDGSSRPRAGAVSLSGNAPPTPSLFKRVTFPLMPWPARSPPVPPTSLQKAGPCLGLNNDPAPACAVPNGYCPYLTLSVLS